MALYVITVGYDEKLPLRFLLRHKVATRDRIVFVSVKGYRKDEKATKAIDSLMKILESNVRIIEIHEVDLREEKILREIAKLAEKIEKMHEGLEEIIVSLSGGMRIIVVVTLLALTVVLQRKTAIIRVEVDYETLTDYSSIYLPVIFLRKEGRELLLLRRLKEKPGAKLKELSADLSLSIPTVHRELKKLKELGLVDIKSNTLTEAGAAFLDLHSEDMS